MAKIPTPNSQLLCAQCGANTSLNAKLPKILESSNLILGKLRADYIPSSSEAKNIRDHVADIQTEVSQRDMEILRLRDALTQLVNARDVLRLRAEETQALIAPIRRIPPELISRIITFALPDSWYTAPSGTIPLIPSHINTSWRNVAHSMGGLWSTIILRLRKPRTVTIMNTYLSRSRDLPLSIHLDEEDTSKKEPENVVLDAIMAHSARWRALYLSLPMSTYERLSPIRGQLPQLEILELRDSAWPYTPHNRALDLFSIAPRLTTVILGRRILPLMFHLPWDQINELKSQSMTAKPKHLMKVAQKFTNLAVLRVYEPWMEKYTHRIPPESVILANLKSLKIKREERHGSLYIPPKTMDALLSIISVPSIESLSLYKVDVTNQFIPMLSRTNSLLTSLSLCHLLNLSEETLIRCLELTPALIKLKYRENTFFRTCSGLLFRRLTPQLSEGENGNGLSDPCLVPQLKILDLSLSIYAEPENMGKLEMEIDLVDMLTARWKSRNDSTTPQVSRLECVNLDYIFSETPSGSGALARLRALQWDGLPMRLQTR